ncbi:hypothetical protein PHMEG_00014822 [Phytophthora megakarya]|uniref:Uncharacterized protein n=1 Tax=Phytophthora megakarya TaxID=4795 RepID=A0A225W3W6_9STRA|nr:hypothetical protein PHMEG_00014822 [Phytophthora megakarya]
MKWRKERREYEDTIRNRAKGETDGLIVPIKNTFDEGMLRRWCRLRWEMSMSDVPDDFILTEVAKIISSVKNNTVPDIDHQMAEHLCMDLSGSDVDERVIQYVKLCHEIIDVHGFLHVNKQRVANESSGSGPRSSTKGTLDRPKKPPTPCPHCNDLHWLSECMSATDTEKAEIRKIKEGAQAVKSKPRLYPPAVRLYLRNFNRKLVDRGWVYKNPIVARPVQCYQCKSQVRPTTSIVKLMIIV